MFEVLHISSQTRNYTDPMEPVYHSEGGVLVSISYGLNNLISEELFTMSFVEINGTLYSKTDGIDGKLYDARIFIEVRPIHFAADIFCLIAHIYITFLTAHYIFSGSLQSPATRSYSHVCIYDIISGNRLIAISMFIATVQHFFEARMVCLLDWGSFQSVPMLHVRISNVLALQRHSCDAQYSLRYFSWCPESSCLFSLYHRYAKYVHQCSGFFNRIFCLHQ